jgi:hypothetical protein
MSRGDTAARPAARHSACPLHRAVAQDRLGADGLSESRIHSVVRDARPSSAAVNIGEGIDQGFDVWNLILIALGAVFIVQAAYRLQT